MTMYIGCRFQGPADISGAEEQETDGSIQEDESPVPQGLLPVARLPH